MRATGDIWEDIVLAYLQRAKLQLLTRNYSSRFGEIDLIMRDTDTLVFVEVRYRDRAALGDGAASVGAGKRIKLIRTASLYLQAQPQFAQQPCRFDVVSCSGTPQQPNIDWQRSAFDAFA
ncbi:YraN family protein [Pseudolysobacter antarcticus]|uniref:UPF0102 protein ELE36_03630 n=1 Tax=Pseudolysobacter antarcticus TaxID=2511995 RepID=A0A411HGC1_9GAMM|nr:YraN family protein [Pseudolysobacter antarcticus]QBB69542.1 YraN family protein [Pseudolysobacter antarcticus]